MSRELVSKSSFHQNNKMIFTFSVIQYLHHKSEEYLNVGLMAASDKGDFQVACCPHAMMRAVDAFGTATRDVPDAVEEVLAGLAILGNIEPCDLEHFRKQLRTDNHNIQLTEPRCRTTESFDDAYAELFNARLIFSDYNEFKDGTAGNPFDEKVRGLLRTE